MSESMKVQPHHLERGAYLYVRQSSMRQVIENVESTKRQYALRSRAIALGWRDDEIVVVDCDQGESGASAAWREGFQHLVAEVSMGRAGMVRRQNSEVSAMTRKILFTSLIVGVSFFPSLGISQVSSNLQGIILSADHAFTGTQAVSSVTLTGLAERYVGPDRDADTITLTARADGSSSVELQGSSGTRTELQDTFSNGQGCSWSGIDSVVHAVAGHNCKMPLAWFLPEVAFFSAQLPANGAISILSRSNANSVPLHWAKLPPASASAEQAQVIAHIGAYNLEFDASSFLPTTNVK